MHSSKTGGTFSALVSGLRTLSKNKFWGFFGEECSRFVTMVLIRLFGYRKLP